jgi:hypothetical protein
MDSDKVGFHKPDPAMVQASREAMSRGEYLTTPQYLAALRAEIDRDEYGSGTGDSWNV